MELADADRMRQEVLDHTAEGAAPLVPEIPLRLLRDDSPLWAAFRDGWNPAELARPYWAFAWSGGQALARYLLDHPGVAVNRRVLDFASGCGIAAIAAARVGAMHVTAADIDPMAAAAATLNADRSGVRIETVCQDLLLSENPEWDLVLAGDMWYDAGLARKAFYWFQLLAGQGVQVLTGDPGRHHSRSTGLEELARYSARSVPDVDPPLLQTAAVYRVRPTALAEHSRLGHSTVGLRPSFGI